MNFSDDNIDTKISLIENLFNYMEGIIKGKYKDDNNSNEISLGTVILEYYNERIDYDSNYFDPYAYINDENENMLENEDNIDNLTLINHFYSYLMKVIDGDINDIETINSLYRMIKIYYNDRIEPISKYFDSYAFTHNLNDIIEELDISDSESIHSESIHSESESESESDGETSTEENENIPIDPLLSKFINSSENEDILLYQKNNKYVSKLDNFLNINNYY